MFDEKLIIILVPVVMALSEIFKRSGLPKKFVPAVNLVLGLIFAIAYVDQSIKIAVFNGIIIGLASSGVYDITVKSLKKSE